LELEVKIKLDNSEAKTLEKLIKVFFSFEEKFGEMMFFKGAACEVNNEI